MESRIGGAARKRTLVERAGEGQERSYEIAHSAISRLGGDVRVCVVATHRKKKKLSDLLTVSHNGARDRAEVDRARCEATPVPKVLLHARLPCVLLLLLLLHDDDIGDRNGARPGRRAAARDEHTI